MGPSKLISNTGKVILGLGLCIIFGLWFLGANMDLPSRSGAVAVNKILSVKSDEIRSESSEVQNNISMSDVKEITNATDMLSLGVGANFSLGTDFNGEGKTIFLSVFDVAQNAKFTQLQGKGYNGDVVVITLTPTLTSILLKTSDNIFEYIGNEFDGILNQVASLKSPDDIYISKSKAQPILDDISRKKITE